MTSSDKATEDILICSVCLEIFKKPKYLPCLHTFCECCLQTYIASGFEKGNKDNIECPICRAPVSVPKTTCTPEEWVKVLPVNFLISRLIENQKASRPEKPCMLCERFASKSVEKAVFICLQCCDTLCETCEKYHRHMKLHSTHEIKLLNEFSDKTQIKCYANTCSEHPDKRIELYCADHEVPCCSLCIAINHRKCEKVQIIEDASKGISCSTMVQTSKRELQTVAADVETVIINYKANLSKIKQQYETQLTKIGNTFENIRNALDEKEKRRKAEFLKVFNEQKDVIETTLVAYQNKQKMVGNTIKILDMCISSTSESQAMIELTKIRQQIDKYKTDIGENAFEFREVDLAVQNCDAETMIKNLDNICTVKCESKSVSFKLKSTHSALLQFNRFTSVESGWSVNSEVDAVSFSVSEEIALYGFQSYGNCDPDKTCTVKAEVKNDTDIMATVETILETNFDENSLTKFTLKFPIHILPNILYDVSFEMTSGGLCKYGEQGKSTLECEGVVFWFRESKLCTNGTDHDQGQIPGFLFKKC